VRISLLRLSPFGLRDAKLLLSGKLRFEGGFESLEIVDLSPGISEQACEFLDLRH